MRRVNLLMVSNALRIAQLVMVMTVASLWSTVHAADSLDLLRRSTDPTWAINCRLLLSGGKATEVIKLLQPERKHFASGADPLFEAFWGRACLGVKSGEAAEKSLAEYMVPQAIYTREYVETYLVATYVLLDRNRFAEAAKMADWIATNDEGLALALGAEASAKAFLGTKEYATAIESAEFAVKYANDKLYDSNHLYDEVFKQLNETLGEARRQQDIGMYGLDFVLFRDAEQLRRQSHDYAKALPIYANIIERFPLGIYADASLVYRANCLIKTGQIQQAEGFLKQYIVNHQDGYYIGEAMLNMATISLDVRIQPGEAAEWTNQLDNWIAKSRNRKTLIAGFNLNPNVAKKVMPPQEKKNGPDAFGNRRINAIEPGQLVNQVTCEWYLNDLEVECAQIRGFLAFAAGRKDEARAQFARLSTLDPDMQGGSIEKNPNDFTRLSWGIEHGYLYAYPQELDLYKDRQRLAILIADFAYITERFSDCADMMKRLLGGEFGPISGDRLEYPRFAMSSALYWMRGRNDACKELLPFLESGKMTWTRQRALLSLANIGGSSDDKDLRVKADKALEILIAVEPPSDWVLQAKLLKAQRYLANGKNSEGVRMLQDLGKMNKDWKELAEFFLAENRISKDKQ